MLEAGGQPGRMQDISRDRRRQQQAPVLLGIESGRSAWGLKLHIIKHINNQ